MSKYGFSIKTARDLLDKAKYDADRYDRMDFDERTWSYALTDYIQTAWHLADWIAAETGQSKTEVRKGIDVLCAGLFKLVEELAIGQKHWEIDRAGSPQNIAKTSAPAARYVAGLNGDPMRTHEKPYVIDNDGNKILAGFLIRDTLSAIEKYLSEV
ncbi:MAG: hypothetical protein IID58_07370 [Proteobacteria bacterium]|nr:hypothetical protein [Pseudomonadota bacterium]